MANDTRYNGWTNYETWAVKLWLDNNEGDYRFWQEQTREAWDEAENKRPNRFMDRSENAQLLLSDRLKDAHDSQSDHPVFAAADGSVYADLLNAALSEVNWQEIANSLLGDLDQENDEETYRDQDRA